VRRPTCPEQLRVWTEEVLQWYRKFPVVLVECQGSPASVAASLVLGHILGSWGQLVGCRLLPMLGARVILAETEEPIVGRPVGGQTLVAGSSE